MSNTRFLPAESLTDFLAFLGKSARVLVPVEKAATAKPSVVFAEWSQGQPFTLAKATVPPKGAVLPECETLLAFRQKASVENGGQSLEDLAQVPEAKPTVVFACRPCDARGFSALDRPFLEGLFADPYYKARREALTVFTLSCATGCATCFCHWVGGGPSSPTGSDVLMTEIAGGYLLQGVSPKGIACLEGSSLADGAEHFPKAEQARREAWKSLVPAPKLASAMQSLAHVFSNSDFWQKHTARCISCGACTYFCPTCYCFNITDEGEAQSAQGGRRLRSWDNCMSSLYTREASGHNPRVRKAERMRNRVSHKFWTYAANWGSYLCSGCGRCIANCPVCLDIRAIVLDAIKTAEQAQNSANPAQ